MHCLLQLPRLADAKGKQMLIVEIADVGHMQAQLVNLVSQLFSNRRDAHVLILQQHEPPGDASHRSSYFVHSTPIFTRPSMKSFGSCRCTVQQPHSQSSFLSRKTPVTVINQSSVRKIEKLSTLSLLSKQIVAHHCGQES